MRAGGKGNDSMEFRHGSSFIGNGDPMKDIKCAYNVLESILQKMPLCQCSGRNGIW